MHATIVALCQFCGIFLGLSARINEGVVQNRPNPVLELEARQRRAL